MPRELPAQTPRVETGPIRFEGDWCGLFLRGDSCLGFRLDLEMILRHATFPEYLGMQVKSLGWLCDLMRQTNEREWPTEPNTEQRP